jgi:TonB family protein
MFEKIYLCLLRLFPAAFRKSYQDEALQLFRDRLRDEQGWTGRLRLGWELLADLIQSLPQAHRNSYPESTAAPSAGTTLTFRTLEQEPMRREAVALASFLSLGALLLFPFVLRWASRDPSRLQSRPSAIESVMDRLNPTTAPDGLNALPAAPGLTSVVPASIQPAPPKTVSVEMQKPQAASTAKIPAAPPSSGIPVVSPAPDARKQPVTPDTPGVVQVYNGQAPEHAVAIATPAPQAALAPASNTILTADILSDTRGINFGPYLKQVVATVQRSWHASLPDGAASSVSETVVRFTISKTGTVSAMTLVESSHQLAADQASWRSITGAGTFPPLPAEFNGPSLTLNLHFMVKSSQ